MAVKPPQAGLPRPKLLAKTNPAGALAPQAGAVAAKEAALGQSANIVPGSLAAGGRMKKAQQNNALSARAAAARSLQQKPKLGGELTR